MSNTQKKSKASLTTEGDDYATVSPPKQDAVKSPVSKLCKDEALHAAASSLHKWHQSAHHLGAEVTLTQTDYDAAIAAASRRKDGKYVPHKPALFTLSKRGS